MKNTEKTKDYCGIAGTPYVWDSMPLGIKTAPAMWMRNMHDGVENPVVQRYQQYMKEHGRLDEIDAHPIRIYFDDCLLHTKNVEDHKLLLRFFFEQCEKMWLTISFHTSFIAKKRVNLLGSEITADQIQPKQKRISKLLALPPPKNVSQLRAWNGALRYTTEMVPNLNISLRNFDRLTGKVPTSTASSHAVVWTRELFNDFKYVRELLRKSTPVYTFDVLLP